MPSLIDRIRFRVLRHLYDGHFVLMMRDESWQEPLFASLAPKGKERVLDFGRGSGLTAVSLASRYPAASFVGADPNPKTVERARKSIARRQLGNVTIIVAHSRERLPFEAGEFDKVVCALTIHDRLPDDKSRVVKELVRVLRRGGTLHIADYDKPTTAGEAVVLTFTRYLSGTAAAESHIKGSWTEFLVKAGLSSVKRQSSHSIRFGRIAVIKAQKR